MENLGRRMKAFSNFMKRGDGNPLELAAMAGEITVEAPKIPDLFPEHTGMKENEDSEAKPEIWQNWDDFVAATNRLADSATALEVVFESGDLGEIGARIKALGDEGCGGCHKKFRQKKE